MAEEKDFKVFLYGKNIPICVLDQKWHRLFALKGKPAHIESAEQELNELLKKQARLRQETVELKKFKAELMDNVVQNMAGTHEENAGHISSKLLDKDKKLIDETNEKLEAIEDELLDIPKEIAAHNQELMLWTVEYCYDKLRVNLSEAREIADWIAQVRIDLKKNIIKKQNREINCRQIYAYMHDIFGADMMDVFDLDGDDIDLSILETPKRKPASGPDGDRAPDGQVTKKDDAAEADREKENFEA